MVNLKNFHWIAMKQFFGYLKNTMNFGTNVLRKIIILLLWIKHISIRM